MPNRTDIILSETKEQTVNSMKTNTFLLLLIPLSLLCGCSENHSITKENMTIFDGYTLFYRGIDASGYERYALMVEDSLNQECIFLNAWYKDASNYKLLVTHSMEVDTIRVLAVLSTANQYKIREIHPIQEHTFNVYLVGEREPILIYLDR